MSDEKIGKSSILDDTGKNTPWTHWCLPYNRRHRSFLASFVIIGLLVVVSIMVYISVTAQPATCSTQECVRISKEFLNHIDASVDPCDDFYRFSCGNFLQNTILDVHGSRSVQDITMDEIQSEIRNMLEQPIHLEDPKAFNLAKKFYRACMNETAVELEGLKKLKQIFEQIGGWPTLEGNNWNDEDFDWMKALHKLRELGVDFDVFFRVSVDKDKRNNSRHILGIYEIPYSPAELNDEAKEIYVNFLTDIAVMFGADIFRAKYDSEKVLVLFLELAKISQISKNITEKKNHDLMSISELQMHHPRVNWFVYISGVLYPAERFTYDDELVVQHADTLKKVEEVIAQTPKRTLANFIVWHTMQYLISYSPSAVVNKTYEFLERMQGKSVRSPRWQQCLAITKEKMGSVISAAFIQLFAQEKARDDVWDIIKRIKEKFRYNLQWQVWLDEKTKHLILDKLMSSRVDIPYYEELLTILNDNKVYDQLDQVGESFLDLALQINYINRNVEFSKLRKPYVEDWWKNITFVAQTLIEYSPRRNALIFPVGIFRGIYYQQKSPQFMRYGILGSIIAHEISHVFVRAEYGASQRELRTWWSPTSLLNYDEKLRCLHNQYRNFVVPELSKHLDSKKTWDEDMADLAGMKISYDTYINWVQENGAEPLLPGLNYSPFQLFWISSAIRHCSKYSRESLERYIDNYQWSPDQFRVNGPLQNLKEFAFDFGCPLGSNMNPINKCLVWSTD